MRCRCVFVAVVCAFVVANVFAQSRDEDAAALRARVMAILADTPLIDGHNDTPWQFRERVQNHVDQIDFRDTSNLDPPMVTDLGSTAFSGASGPGTTLPTKRTVGSSSSATTTTL